jgi:hypothetical protein
VEIILVIVSISSGLVCGEGKGVPIGHHWLG